LREHASHRVTRSSSDGAVRPGHMNMHVHASAMHRCNAWFAVHMQRGSQAAMQPHWPHAAAAHAALAHAPVSHV
jgi:hypothetical protein